MEPTAESMAALSAVRNIKERLSRGSSSCIQPILSCLLSSSKCLNLYMLTLLPSATLVWMPFTTQTKHHQPPADCHQHVLLWVTSSPSVKNMALSPLPLSPPTISCTPPSPLTPCQVLYSIGCDLVCPILYLLPAAKRSRSPLPHPQRAYKFRVSNLFMDPLSVQ